MAYYLYDLETGDVFAGADNVRLLISQVVGGTSLIYEEGSLRDWQYFTVVDGVIVTDIEELSDDMRADRDSRLLASDYTQLADSTHPGSKSDWATYRQLLRDVPNQTAFPNVINWPAEPTDPVDQPEE